MRIGAFVLAFVALTSCSTPPCVNHRVVKADAPPVGVTVDQIRSNELPWDVELDDGHVYRATLSRTPTTGDEIEVCEVRSKIDGSMHFSLTEAGYSAVDAQRLR